MYKPSSAKFETAAGLALLGCLHVVTIKRVRIECMTAIKRRKTTDVYSPRCFVEAALCGKQSYSSKLIHVIGIDINYFAETEQRNWVRAFYAKAHG